MIKWINFPSIIPSLQIAIFYLGRGENEPYTNGNSAILLSTSMNYACTSASNWPVTEVDKKVELAYYNQKVYTIGGSTIPLSRLTGTRHFWSYEPATNNWTQLAALPKGRYLSKVVVFDEAKGELWIMGKIEQTMTEKKRSQVNC